MREGREESARWGGSSPLTRTPARSFVLTEGHKRYFEKLVIYCDQYASLIPLSFVLGVFALEFPVPHPRPQKPFMPSGDPPLLPLWDAPQIQPHRPPLLRPLDRCGPLAITWSPAP